MGTPTTGTTGLGSPQDDLQNHTRILRQLKETTEVAQRQRGDPNNSFVRLGELLSTLAFKYTNNQLSFNGSTSGGSSSINVADSVTGAGTVASPLQLSGDSASPGNSMYYGTNASGTKGYFALPAGGSLSVTDGTHTVTGTTSMTFSGATVSGSTPNATVTITGASIALPGTIPDLVAWFAFDNINSAAGKIQTGLFDKTPWRTGAAASLTTSTVAISSTQLNSLNTVTWPNGNAFPLIPSFSMAGGGTYFIVIKGATSSGNQAIIGGSTNCLSLYLGVGAPNIQLVDGSTALLTASTATWTVGTWFQANVTYNSSTGAFAYRQARAAANSGTTGTFTVTPCSYFGSDAGTSTLNGASVAEFIAYNRILSGTEITNVENYLFAKWGV